MAKKKKAYVVGSGNVFADLGHPRPAEALAKAELARKIGAIIERRGLTQAAAAQVLEIDQPKVSALTRGAACRVFAGSLSRAGGKRRGDCRQASRAGRQTCPRDGRLSVASLTRCSRR
jgi:predicted XRE-type DNA-binding protein